MDKVLKPIDSLLCTIVRTLKNLQYLYAYKNMIIVLKKYVQAWHEIFLIEQRRVKLFV
jgi:hypothetical protein